MGEKEEDDRFARELAEARRVADQGSMEPYARVLSGRLRQMDKRARAANKRADEAEAKLAKVVQKADAALFHYWCCGSDDGCGKVAPSMAELAAETGFDQVSVMGDEIRAVLASSGAVASPAVSAEEGEGR